MAIELIQSKFQWLKMYLLGGQSFNLHSIDFVFKFESHFCSTPSQQICVWSFVPEPHWAPLASMLFDSQSVASIQRPSVTFLANENL